MSYEEDVPEQPEWCDFCGWVTLKLTMTTSYGAEPLWLCDLCRATPAGNVALHPNTHPEADLDVLKTLIIIGHILIEKVPLR